MQSLTRTTASSCSWDTNGCSHKCAQSYSVSVTATETSVTLMPTSNPAGCTCSAGSGIIDSATDEVVGTFGDGSSFHATPGARSEDSVTIVHTCSNPDGCDSGSCEIDYAIRQKVGLEEPEIVAAAGGIWLFMSCLAFVIPLGGIHMCIKSKAQRGARPTAMAWVGCLVIFCFTGPCFMWLPFVLDSCYQSSNPNWNVSVGMQQHYGGQPQQGYGQQLQQGHEQQPIMATAVAMPQPAVVQATAVAMPTASATATATAVSAVGAPPGYGGRQPPVATVTAA
eukprot:COSAG02_NODE_2990_length_7607_cov_3.437134_7_plen_281_part_00